MHFGRVLAQCVFFLADSLQLADSEHEGVFFTSCIQYTVAVKNNEKSLTILLHKTPSNAVLGEKEDVGCGCWKCWTFHKLIKTRTELWCRPICFPH